jgi:NADPH2:quinone reductase
MVKMLPPGPPRPPLTPGYEVSGIVKEVGPGVQNCKVGDRVAAFPGIGAYAEEAAASADLVYPMPDDMDFATGAGFVATYGTSYHALHDRAHLQAGETVLILGASGGAGLTAVEIAKRMGAHVIAAASSDQKLALCKQYGADEVVNYSTGDLRAQVTDLTKEKGLDVVYDPVGGQFTEPAIKLLKPLGRYLVIGFASGEPTVIPAGLLLVKQIAAIGIFWGEFMKLNPSEARRSINQLFEWYAAGKVRPLISESFPLDQAQTAMQRLVDRKATGKVVLTTI